ncbi:MAG: hypothetical protein ABF723_13630 [Lentilactobacillus hilgardii]|jgi:hypothetical protein|uniref:Uncharacterized protein n=1 Tax=Lentilactobacillus hilgardii TaxID=1588 RepID=A0A6P1E4K9_LENHI|nr:hypothetical protein [Lentilactobacillus hilgardii]RRG07007.1 MAG: hypothetical protein DUD35_14125 [Lactobacillus sp.]EEI71642.1 hypothetical protein HMPREF0496_1156 [Lentilactobacillus hilgardii ATCC 27305]MBZ2201552.1 hypothetical protein [Lentilactobacillus hilgardii]MBZ2204470.1 hypothetical protein [Lentilactobacillus hilgardii]MCT3392946.1 hypothetical protein [Lentilactobacillus hilgardii]
MNVTKQRIINDLINIMTDHQDSAIRNLSMRVLKDGHQSRTVHPTPFPEESIPSNHSLACFNVAAELTNLMMNNVDMTKLIVKKYTPGIVDALVHQNPTDYNNPHNVERVINNWLGLKTTEH